MNGTSGDPGADPASTEPPAKALDPSMPADTYSPSVAKYTMPKPAAQDAEGTLIMSSETTPPAKRVVYLGGGATAKWIPGRGWFAINPKTGKIHGIPDEIMKPFLSDGAAE